MYHRAVQPRPPVSWQITLLALLLAATSAGVIQQYESYTFLHGDGAFYATINRAILEGTLQQRGFQPASWFERPMGWNNDLDIGWSNMSQGPDGTWWPKHPILLPILTTPLYWLLGPLGALVANVLLLCLGLLCAARLAARLADPTVAGLTALAFAALPLMTHSAYSYSNDVMYAALVVAGVECYVSAAFGWSGFLLALAVWSKPPMAVFPGLLGLTLLGRRQWRPALAMVLGGLPPSIALFGQNLWMFGSPLTFSYDRILVTRGGRAALEAAGSKMHRPLWAGLRAVWQDDQQGLRQQVSWGLTALLGVPLWLRAAPLLGMTFLLTLCGFFLFYAKWDYTYARFYLPWLLLSVVPAALLLQRIAALAVRAAALPRRWLLLAALTALAATVLTVVTLRRPTTRWSATRAIGHARVERGSGRDALPCDFFNPRWQKWECAQVDREPWQTWGLALNDQCRFPGEAGPWLWLHPNPGTARRITFDGVPPGRLRLRYGMDPKAREPGLRLVIRALPGTEQALTVPDVGRIHALDLPRHASSVTIEVPDQPWDWRLICAQLDVL